MHFTQKEVRDLVLAWLAISVAFAILFTGPGGILSFSFLTSLGVSALTAGIGFLLHELMHKFVAQKYGMEAHFVAFYGMLALAILFSFGGFILAAPGAVAISGLISKSRHGKIALAGPVTNIVLAVLFALPLLFGSYSGTLQLLFTYGLKINALLAAFNMIPAGPFDGAKVYAWDKKVFYTTGIFAVLLFIASFFI